jgi:hypothetical protein
MRQDSGSFRGSALALALLVAAAGCGRNAGDVPSDFSPAGQNGLESQLTVEMINTATDSGVVTPAVRLRVYDRTSASGYKAYRRLPGQGFDRLDRDPARFDGSFNEDFETYEAVDRDWAPDRSVDYLARGEVAGVESPGAPLTNTATLPGIPVADSLFAKPFRILCPVPPTPDAEARVDSTPVLVWESVPGAVRYLLRVIRLDNRLFFYGFTPSDGSHSYHLGSGVGEVMHENTLTLRGLFNWWVEALDTQSRVIARSDTLRFETRPIVQADSLIFCTP